MTLDVVISTYGPDGILRVSERFLPILDGVKYIVNWQKHEDISVPEKLKRKDIIIYRSETLGSSNNRNEGISYATADIVYLADDDVDIINNGLNKIIKCFQEYPDTELATFMMREKERKKYPKAVTELSFYLPKNYNVASYQMAFRREMYPDVKFHTSFGINSGVFESGEDELFHLCARKKGVKCRFFPEIIASHPHEATGRRKIENPKVIEGMGAVITLSFPKTFLIRLPLRAFRLWKAKRYAMFPALFYLFNGSLKSYGLNILND